MFVAYDKDKNRVYADDGVKHTGCVCPACNAEVIHRAVDSLYRVPHFAHKPKTKCSYEFDKDYMSEWHRRMQGYFAKEEIEYRFTNEAGKVVHIADAYSEKYNTVFEFQHSPISLKEFKRRTDFHIDNKRRIVWIFDVSSENNPFIDTRFIPVAQGQKVGPYAKRMVLYYEYKSLLSDIISFGPSLEKEGYSIYLYAMRKKNSKLKGDIIHRLIHLEQKNRKFFVLSLHDIVMSTGLDIEEFFYPESHWQKEEEKTWQAALAAINKANQERRKEASNRLDRQIECLKQQNERLRQRSTKKKSNDEFDERFRQIMGWDEESQGNKPVLSEQFIAERASSWKIVEEATERARQYEEKEKLDREDYWKALLEFVKNQVKQEEK